ncbi:putative F-box domain-containing protein [Medicago truncatula]|uniref:F-box and associated interaction domain protein, putative n=1 Tax=Medicago truncatula TaxID=3880 RepID=G7IW49_MEDTR|nr:F-box and associated interaction domain protein, putative [Medicago truncatula]RHN65836.1 putative F-box domain-containing protein [Medicago truncatula]
MATKSDKVSNSNYISDDISFSILSKLPLKSLNRFTCASKSWSLLFQNPNFMQLFRTNFIFMHRSLYDHTFLILYIKEILPHPQDGSNLYLLSAEEFKEFIALWNPATKELENVPSNPAESLPFNTVWFCLHGYGYDPINDDYKIIRRVYVNQYKPHDDVDWTYLPTIPRPFWEIYLLEET